MILEGIVTTKNEDGATNISPMGPKVEPGFDIFELRPFTSSRTYANLKRTQCGVFHIVDDVLLVAQAAIDDWIERPTLVSSDQVNCERIDSACQSLEFVVTYLDDSTERTTIKCEIKQRHDGPQFFGFNRAKHSVLEAAILATRINFIPIQEIRSRFSDLNVIIGKTGGEREKQAFDLLESYVNKE